MPPKSSFAVLSDTDSQQLVQSSPFASKYGQAIDRESAYEKLAAKVLEENQLAQEAMAAAQREKEAKEAAKKTSRRSVGRPRKSAVEKAADGFISTTVRTIGRELVRGLLGSLRKR